MLAEHPTKKCTKCGIRNRQIARSGKVKLLCAMCLSIRNKEYKISHPESVAFSQKKRTEKKRVAREITICIRCKIKPRRYQAGNCKYCEECHREVNIENKRRSSQKPATKAHKKHYRDVHRKPKIEHKPNSMCSKCRVRPRASIKKVWCKECTHEYNQNYNKTHTVEIKLKRAISRNSDKVRAQKRAWSCTPKGRAYIEKRKTLGRAAESDRNYRQRHPDKIRAKNRRLAPRYRQKPKQKLRRNLRNRLWYVLKGGLKVGSAVRDLGCSIEFLKHHLETQFQPGMTWDNYGGTINNWCVDHIIPLSSFDLTDREQFLKACHYSNLQPMWFSDNSRKCNRLDY